MDEQELSALKALLRDPSKSNLETVKAFLYTENKKKQVSTAPCENQRIGAQNYSSKILNLSLALLQHSSSMLKNQQISTDTHAQFEITSIKSILSQFPTIREDSTGVPSDTLDIHFVDVIFTEPLIFSNISLDRLQFTDCEFKNVVHFTGVKTSKTIEFKNCIFTKEKELLIRMLHFVKPEPASSWRPSFTFEKCSIEYLYTMKAHVFLFFKDSVIRSSSIELLAGSTVQYVNCRVSDGIEHSLDEHTDGYDLVQKGWHLERGWSLE